MKAIVACAHKLLRINYKILSTKKCRYDTKKALGLRQQTRAIAEFQKISYLIHSMGSVFFFCIFWLYLFSNKRHLPKTESA